MAESGADSITVPVKVPEPDGKAPPTLAEPASGPAAEMSGALHKDDVADAAASAGANARSAMNGTSTAVSQAESHTAPEKAAYPAADAPAPTQDTEMTEAPAETSQTAVETNGTPSDKKTPNGKRKSTGGIPEHKNKKLNKKKSMPKMTHLDAQPGDYFFARLKSYPPWPSMICSEDMLPSSLLNTRPVTTKKADGTYNEAYIDGGKKVVERTFPVMFLHTNEFAWIPNTDLATLTPDECKDVAEKGKSKSLIQAYHVAAEGHDIQYFKEMLMDHARALQEDEDAKEARAAEKAAKADKKKRKSEVKAADADVEMEDGDATPAAKKSSKKRKKEVESDDEEPDKPAKTPKTTKLKLTTNKTPATTEKKAKEPKSAKPKSDKKKKATVEDDAAEIEEKIVEKPLDPIEEREARKKEVLFLRHKLQKGFLARDQTPREDEMGQMNNYIKKLEVYPDLEPAIIRETKINKVLKALVKLSSIPRDDEFQFKKRSVDLLTKWNNILSAEPMDNADADEKAGPATNGVHEDKNDDTEESRDKVVTSDTANYEVSADVLAQQEAEARDEALEKEAEVKKAAETLTAPASASEQQNAGEAKNLVSAPTLPTEPALAGEGVQVVEKAPESAVGAAEAADVVKATE